MNVLLEAGADLCPSSAAFFGFMGVTAALVFASTWFRSGLIPSYQTLLTVCRVYLFVGHRWCFFPDLGAAYGTAKSGVGIASMGVMRPELVMRNVVPVVMAGVLGIYGLIVGAILLSKSTWGMCLCLDARAPR